MHVSAIPADTVVCLSACMPACITVSPSPGPGDCPVCSPSASTGSSGGTGPSAVICMQGPDKSAHSGQLLMLYA